MSAYYELEEGERYFRDETHRQQPPHCSDYGF